MALALDDARRCVTSRRKRARRAEERTAVRPTTAPESTWFAQYERDRAVKGYRWAAAFEAEFGWWPGCVGEKPDALADLVGEG